MDPGQIIEARVGGSQMTTELLDAAGKRSGRIRLRRFVTKSTWCWSRSCFCLLLALFLICGSRLGADEVTLKNGMRLQGRAVRMGGMSVATSKENNRGPVPSTAYYEIDDDVRRYYIHQRFVRGVEQVAELGPIVSFKMKTERRTRGIGFSAVGSFVSVEPFDEFGRRTVTLMTQKGPVPIVQAITHLRPDYCTLVGLEHAWEYNVDTRSIPPAVLKSVIERASNRDDRSDRKAAVQFYVQTQLYEYAQAELKQIAERFEDQKEWCEQTQLLLDELIARRVINEIERRQLAGQHQQAMYAAKLLPEGQINADISQRVRDLLANYEDALVKRDLIVMQLDLLQAELPTEQSQRLSSMRAILAEEMQYELMPRLDPFLRAIDDNTLQPAQKLALAYSAWLLGTDQATLDLDEAIRLWDARFQILEFLRTERDPERSRTILQTLNEMESISVPRVARMITNLPLPYRPGDVQPTVPSEVTFTVESSGKTVKYTVVLPPEYSPAHSYPLLVVLRSERSTTKSAAQIWAGTPENPGWAQRRGYIVIAPAYCSDETVEYNAGTVDLESILLAMNHARKRFHVNSDRIFVTGHGMGGDTCFDVALSHPGLFAGIIPINGNGGPIAKAYRHNGPKDRWYIVSGERDRALLDQNASFLNKMINQGQQVIYCEYKARGFEGYFEEQERIFDWMQLQQRTPLSEQTEFECGILRKTDTQMYWVQAGGFSDRYFPPIDWGSPTLKLPVTRPFNARISPSGLIRITHPGTSTTVWLSPESFDFSKKCEVRVNNREAFRDFVKPTLEDLLTDLRSRGDRERLYWVRLTL